VLGLGLIGGSLLRAARAAGREVFGYNRSVEAVRAARAEGFDATDNLDEALRRAAAADALVVLAVPVPALPILLAHIRDTAPGCPLTDVTSVKGRVLEEVRAVGLLDRFVGGHPMAGTAESGWAAGDAGLFTGAPWVVAVDDHVDPHIWAQVMALALDCGSFVVPARSLAAGSFRDGTRVAATAPDLVRAMCEANAEQLVPVLDRALDLLHHARAELVDGRPITDLVEAGHAARTRYESFPRPDIVTVVIGEERWREELAAQGRAGGVIRSALPVRDSRR